LTLTGDGHRDRVDDLEIGGRLGSQGEPVDGRAHPQGLVRTLGVVDHRPPERARHHGLWQRWERHPEYANPDPQRGGPNFAASR